MANDRKDVCRFRKSEGLPCRRCCYSANCKEYNNIAPKKIVKKPRPANDGARWTAEEDAIVMRDDLKIHEIANKLYRTVPAVWNRRVKLIRRGKKNEV